MRQYIDEIARLKKERNAVILSHLYQPGEIQEIADYVGDSLGLAQQAAETDAAVIVSCGVRFMAETASILSPDKIVLIPDIAAGCPMADMVTEETLRKKKEELPDAIVVCYVNTTAGVKALCDIACTSANAEAVIRSLPADKPILFVPDKNLGRNISNKTGREMILWDGCCSIHDELTPDQVTTAKAAYPEALVRVHPECLPEIIALADVVSSTTGMIKYATDSSANTFIIGTEMGILHPLLKACPKKEFHFASTEMICQDMKKTTLEKVSQVLKNMAPRIEVPQNIRENAVRCLDNMLAVKQ
ncbi:MAG: quinolinate synthase NadA [Peptococcaceae bacterium]|nr:quinolinate synthase NadA [Peptococcaceae bacterium]